MSQKLLQVNLKYSGLSGAELERAWLPVAHAIANTAGLGWKIWLMNEREHEAGGIYIFDDEASAQAFLTGPIVAALTSDSHLSGISARMFDVMERHTAITRGPVREGSRV